MTKVYKIPKGTIVTVNNKNNRYWKNNKVCMKIQTDSDWYVSEENVDWYFDFVRIFNTYNKERNSTNRNIYEYFIEVLFKNLPDIKGNNEAQQFLFYTEI